ncbi:tumor necrosis factor receptor superfamily member 5-like [Mya arenaria]|uniref:tumor necrosis factor receptor superfamily member 5-like n=1 Tax=Mya arenaria TaxID=6604 RepID=UPI0022E7DF97|nr:tumor necrosis factor receptor superfamily member 5-like [Mya arenaria]XP_052820925.1 tumor necrosis factor receptor superfamily member 5-like [Mya arenaria]XP_052820926.1 tumor necrosis factor receptor superfamily member 5-like [Mya arenaria]XP_052820927.1 tumor necrosis factor receptor superfamily member 5-like [Mya arenaria]XP_052820928.1 tumor necrosis factor receptor superfamily member 5-like [Mya arenaria]XP_052820929.1 tumor necrosis factor receptor superfamily member 5-like [Mya are
MGGELVVCGLMVLGLATQVIWAKFDDTYYIVETNGEYIHCKKCPHGTYWLQNCDRDGGQATCEECPDGRFMEDFNRALYCKKCTECKGNHKESREVVAAECTRFHDTKCQCIEGYWREEGRVGDCRSVSPCKQGYGVKKLADSHNNTTCERCVNGKTFSNVSSEKIPCQNCSLCPVGWVQKIPCSEYEDIVCIPKDEDADDGVALIVGVVCGVIFAVALLVVIIIFCCCREKTRKVLQKLPCRKGTKYETTDTTDPNGEFVRVTVEAGNEDNNSEPEVDQELARLAIANDTGLFSDLSLLRISGNIGQWLQLALELGLSNAERERIVIDFHSAIDQIHKALTSWRNRQRQGKKSDEFLQDELVQALHNASYGELANQLQTYSVTEMFPANTNQDNS